ncbi:4-coumarate-CoA ligase [Paracoccidioides lutzii Pb01]|uniref:4-coumarate-CoA ligase n=1 Tax=Paracoccidioides lutzii (strain ATCC MYA-826 / Pb01) TaxID=502779 RepID=C1HDY8_PARBA|nr:4-coumarate-CoA ligase [Paracoccidioides lutzii Pb01]EEH40132.2 4-coumarate-CoA ligase [Paracoccidioides lutzii Pb01]
MQAQSPYPPVDIPNVDLWSLLFEKKKRLFADDKGYDIPRCRHSPLLHLFPFQVKSIALDFGKGLKATWNWQKGDVLALLSPNDIDIPPVIWGTHWPGGAVTLVNLTYTAEELSLQLKGTKARVLVTQIFPAQRGIAKRASIQRRIWRFSFSSGTTGIPKGVMLSHRNIVSNIIQITAGEEHHLSCAGGKDRNGDKVLAFLPFFHIYGLSCLVHKSMYTGIQLVVMSKSDIKKWCAHVQNFGITFSYIVPPVAVLLSKHSIVEEYDLPSLRLMNSGATPLSRELVNAVYARIKTGVKQGYGLSETSPTTHTQAWGDWNKFIGSEIKYMTSPDDGSEPVELHVGRTGEIYVRGPNVFLGYLNNPEATAACLSQDGWFRTGDVGHQDEHGNLYITDRVKERIKYKGFQVAPAELEGVLVENELIANVAVIGVESEVHGSEVPRAFVVLSGKKVEDGTAADAEQIVQWLAGKVAPHKRLRGGVRFVHEIPKSASGKILRRVLKDRARKEDTVERLKAKL